MVRANPILLVVLLGCSSGTAPYTEACRSAVVTRVDSTRTPPKIDTVAITYTKTFYCQVKR